MSGFLSPKMMRFRESAVAAEADVDRPCEGCGYNLRGLPLARPCPECGNHSGVSMPGGGVRAIGDLLLKGSLEERRRWHLGFRFAFAAMLTMVIARVLYFPLTLSGTTKAFEVSYHGVGALAAFAFIVATFQLTPPVLAATWRWMAAATIVTRLGALLWIPAYALLFLNLSATTPSEALAWADRLCRVGAAIAAGVLFLQLHVVALFSDCEAAGRRLNNLAWIGGFASLVLWPFGAQPHWLLALMQVVIIGAWAWVMLWGVLAFLELAEHLRWADRHAVERVGRDERVRKKKEAFDRATQATVRELPRSDDGEIAVEPGARSSGETRDGH